MLDQFRKADKAPVKLEETYLMGNRLIKFLAVVLRKHHQYYSKDVAVTRLRIKSENDLAQVRIEVDDIALKLDKLYYDEYIKGSDTALPPFSTTNFDSNSSKSTGKKVSFALHSSASLTVKEAPSDIFVSGTSSHTDGHWGKAGHCFDLSSQCNKNGECSITSSKECHNLSFSSGSTASSTVNPSLTDTISQRQALNLDCGKIVRGGKNTKFSKALNDSSTSFFPVALVDDGWEHLSSWPDDDLGWPCSVDQLPVRGDDDPEQSDDSDSSSSGMEESSDEGLTFVEKIAHENIVHDINHDEDEDSDAIDSWAQEENDSISYGIELHDNIDPNSEIDLDEVVVGEKVAELPLSIFIDNSGILHKSTFSPPKKTYDRGKPLSNKKKNDTENRTIDSEDKCEQIDCAEVKNPISLNQSFGSSVSDDENEHEEYIKRMTELEFCINFQKSNESTLSSTIDTLNMSNGFESRDDTISGTPQNDIPRIDKMDSIVGDKMDSAGGVKTITTEVEVDSKAAKGQDTNNLKKGEIVSGSKNCVGCVPTAKNIAIPNTSKDTLEVLHQSHLEIHVSNVGMSIDDDTMGTSLDDIPRGDSSGGDVTNSSGGDKTATTEEETDSEAIKEQDADAIYEKGIAFGNVRCDNRASSVDDIATLDTSAVSREHLPHQQEYNSYDGTSSRSNKGPLKQALLSFEACNDNAFETSLDDISGGDFSGGDEIDSIGGNKRITIEDETESEEYARITQEEEIACVDSCICSAEDKASHTSEIFQEKVHLPHLHKHVPNVDTLSVSNEDALKRALESFEVCTEKTIENSLVDVPNGDSSSNNKALTIEENIDSEAVAVYHTEDVHGKKLILGNERCDRCIPSDKEIINPDTSEVSRELLHQSHLHGHISHVDTSNISDREALRRNLGSLESHIDTISGTPLNDIPRIDKIDSFGRDKTTTMENEVDFEAAKEQDTNSLEEGEIVLGSKKYVGCIPTVKNIAIPDTSKVTLEVLHQSNLEIHVSNVDISSVSNKDVFKRALTSFESCDDTTMGTSLDDLPKGDSSRGDKTDSSGGDKTTTTEEETDSEAAEEHELSRTRCDGCISTVEDIVSPDTSEISWEKSQQLHLQAQNISLNNSFEDESILPIKLSYLDSEMKNLSVKRTKASTVLSFHKVSNISRYDDDSPTTVVGKTGIFESHVNVGVLPISQELYNFDNSGTTQNIYPKKGIHTPLSGTNTIAPQTSKTESFDANHVFRSKPLSLRSKIQNEHTNIKLSEPLSKNKNETIIKELYYPPHILKTSNNLKTSNISIENTMLKPSTSETSPSRNIVTVSCISRKARLKRLRASNHLNRRHARSIEY